MERYERVCPVENAGQLDIGIRKWLQNPAKMLNGQVREGMVVLELGCGTGYFTGEIARRVGETGKVIAADLQQGMLDMVKSKFSGTELENRIMLHKCEEDKIGVTEKVDLIVAFFMVHEVPDRKRMLLELKSILKPGGSVYIAEFRGHPPKKAFEDMVIMAKEVGFVEAGRTGALISRSIILK
jgi:ubiquinone/menaquinone biosynthesis C-methylase UbiE